jgi:hypothetical protein
MGFRPRGEFDGSLQIPGHLQACNIFEVLHNQRPERIRLSGIDCPEKGQAFGKKAKQFTFTLIHGKEVTIQVLGKDRHGRTVADVVLPDGRNVSRELVKAGLAWWYRQYSEDESLGSLEDKARQAKRGLWADPIPIPPWEQRHPKQDRTLSTRRDLLSEPSENPPGTISTAIIGNLNFHVYHQPDCPITQRRNLRTGLRFKARLRRRVSQGYELSLRVS